MRLIDVDLILPLLHSYPFLTLIPSSLLSLLQHAMELRALRSGDARGAATGVRAKGEALQAVGPPRSNFRQQCGHVVNLCTFAFLLLTTLPNL